MNFKTGLFPVGWSSLLWEVFMADVIELMTRQMVRKAYEKGKMFEFILGFRDFWKDKNWANKYEAIAKNEFKRILHGK